MVRIKDFNDVYRGVLIKGYITGDVPVEVFIPDDNLTTKQKAENPARVKIEWREVNRSTDDEAKELDVICEKKVNELRAWAEDIELLCKKAQALRKNFMEVQRAVSL